MVADPSYHPQVFYFLPPFTQVLNNFEVLVLLSITFFCYLILPHYIFESKCIIFFIHYIKLILVTSFLITY